jgi:hypothetical protein
MLSRNSLIGALAVVIVGLAVTSSPVRGDVVLNFNDVTTLTVSTYQSQGFTLTSTSGGFVFNSPDTGNGSSQTPGSNFYYAGANGLAAFTPATITLVQTSGDPFSLLSIDLARNFAFDPAPTVTFTGTLAGGGTITETLMVTERAGFPQSFTPFDFTGFTNLTSVSWDQPVPTPTDGLNQFTDITLSTVPEPSSLITAGGIGAILMAVAGFRARHRRERAQRIATLP